MSWRGIFRKAGINIENNTFTFDKNKDMVIRRRTSLTTGSLRGLYNILTLTGAGTDAEIEGIKSSVVVSDIKTGSWINAITGSINFSTSGSVHGMAASICAEMIPPNSSLTRGGLYALDCCFGCGASSSWGSAGPVAFLRFENWGTKDYFSANAFLFHLYGETGAAGALLSENSRTLKVRIGSTTKYLYLSDTEDDLGAMYVDNIVLAAAEAIGILISTSTPTIGLSITAACETAGISIAGDCVTGITIGAQTTAGITIGATATGIGITAATTGISISGAGTNALVIAQTGSTATDGYALKLGASGAHLTTATADASVIKIYADTTSGTGDNRGIYNRFYIKTAGAGGGESLRSYTEITNVETGTAHGAHISLGMGESTDAGSVTGLGVAVRCTLGLPDVALPANGTYSALMAEIYSFGDASDAGAVTELSFLRVVNGGTTDGKATVDDDAFFAVLDGFADGAAHMWYVHAPTTLVEAVRVKTPGGIRYIGLYSTP